MASGTPQITTSEAIPYLYRFLLLNVEPLCALGGVLLCLRTPERYLSTMTRESVTTIDPRTQFIYTELAGGWLHFAFTELIVLRFVDDLRVWRLLCIGMLLSDIAYCHSCAQAVGGWNSWIDVSKWTVEDWTVTITTWPFAIARAMIVLGIGFKSTKSQKRS